MNEIILEFKSLHKSYGNIKALNGLDLVVREGQITGMIGPDAAGKTTAIRIACGLLVPDQGTASIMGFDCSSQSQNIKEHIGYMPQRFSLYPDLSIEENLRFFADLYEVPKEERKKREAELYKFSHLEPFKKRHAGRLSGGMKQKLALSCTLIHTPKILLLDEPTTGVDPVSRQEFWNILRSLTEQGMALLVSTPYMDEADLCDQVALVHQGRVLIKDSPDKIPEYFHRKILSIYGEEMTEALKRLKKLDNMAVHRFGDSLHLIYEVPGDREKIKEILNGLKIKIDQIKPSIEDTFVEMLNTEQTGSIKE